MAIKNVCRICLTDTIEKDITELSQELEGDNYWDIMLFCLNIQVLPESKLTTKLCIKCYTNIISFHNFKVLALKSDAYLRCFQNDEDNKYNICVKYEELSNGHADDILCEIEKLEETDCVVKNEENIDETASDDELLSAVKKIKYEYISEIIEESEVIPSKEKNIKVKLKKLNREEERKKKICDECGKTVINLHRHKALHKPVTVRKRYKCKVCEKTFATCSARYNHNKTKHLGIKQHCNECDKDVVSLYNHRQVMHNEGDLPHECVPCGRKFISKAKKDFHMLIHTKDRPFRCDQCDKTFRSKFGLLQHIRQVHNKEKSHLCQVCSKTFFKRYHLQVHLRSHSNEKPYECPDCGKCFASCTLLKNHRMIHSDVKNFVCDLCDMAFKKAGYLRNHMISHTKEKRFLCKYCDMPFGRSDHRLRHERTAHERHQLAVM